MSQVAGVLGFEALPTTTLTGAVVAVSRAVSLKAMNLVSFISVFTGTLSGTVSYQVSNDKPSDKGDQPNASATWVDLTLPAGFSAGNPSGTPLTFDASFVDLGEGWIRAVFTNTSGTGTARFIVAAKGL